MTGVKRARQMDDAGRADHERSSHARGGLPSLARKLIAEGVGTALLVTVVVGSGIAAQTLSPGQTGLQLLENSVATMLGLAVLILMLGPVSGAHFNPVVSAADYWVGRHGRGGLTSSVLCLYI